MTKKRNMQKTMPVSELRKLIENALKQNASISQDNMTLLKRVTEQQETINRLRAQLDNAKPAMKIANGIIQPTLRS